MPNQKLPPAEVLAELRAQGWTYAMIQQAYGVSHAAVHYALRRAGLIERPWTRYDAFPWPRIESQDTQAHTLRMLRYAYWLEIRKPLPSGTEPEVRNWIAWMQQGQWVVAYSPEDGFTYVPRRADDIWLVRKPEEQTQTLRTCS